MLTCGRSLMMDSEKMVPLFPCTHKCRRINSLLAECHQGQVNMSHPEMTFSSQVFTSKPNWIDATTCRTERDQKSDRSRLDSGQVRNWVLRVALHLVNIIELLKEMHSPLIQQSNHISANLGKAPQEHSNLPAMHLKNFFHGVLWGFFGSRFLRYRSDSLMQHNQCCNHFL